jgi:3',5'-cyclic-AMP phosphodiesterase
MEDDVITKIAQLTDCHLLSDSKDKLLGVNTDQSFKACLEKSKNLKPDLLLLSGDVTEDGSIDAYERIKDYLDHTELNYVLIPGNHDNIPNMKYIFRDKLYLDKALEVNGWNLLLLNSVIEKQIYGSISLNGLELIRENLKKNLPIGLFLHHHPKPLGSPLMDKYALDNPEDLKSAISGSNGLLKFICCGHVHQEHQSDIDGIDFLTTPSTCMQFQPGMRELELDEVPPGMRCFELKDNGSYETKVVRL